MTPDSPLGEPLAADPGSTAEPVTSASRRSTAEPVTSDPAEPVAVEADDRRLLIEGVEHPDFDDVAQAVLFETPEKLTRITSFLERRSAGALVPTEESPQ